MKKSFFILLLLIAGISYNGDIGESITPDMHSTAGAYTENQVEEDTIVINELNLFSRDYFVAYNNPGCIPLENYTPVWKPPVNS